MDLAHGPRVWSKTFKQKTLKDTVHVVCDPQLCVTSSNQLPIKAAVLIKNGQEI